MYNNHCNYEVNKEVLWQCSTPLFKLYWYLPHLIYHFRWFIVLPQLSATLIDLKLEYLPVQRNLPNIKMWGTHVIQIIFSRMQIEHVNREGCYAYHMLVSACIIYKNLWGFWRCLSIESLIFSRTSLLSLQYFFLWNSASHKLNVCMPCKMHILFYYLYIWDR